MVSVNLARTRSTLRVTVWTMPPTVLVQPKGSSIFLRRFWDRA
ncbi:hypothetical protein J2Z33_002194 [Rubellimicrobium aerolatum]|nr:hypothetical protein [Rubellimicrobium aerolatum]